MSPRPTRLLLDHELRIYLQGAARGLRCCLRNVEVRASEEEKIRQLVLHWLLTRHAIARSNIRVEEPVRFTNRTRGRADIVICDAEEKPLVVVECKRPGSTGYAAETQAIRYARKLGPPHIWVTDGTQHRMLARTQDGSWRETPRLPFLRELRISQVPSAPSARYSLAKARMYLRQFRNGRRVKDGDLVRFATSAHRLILGDTISPPPYSWRGLHVLEDRGVSWLSIKTPGGSWESFYRILLVATEGRVETAGIGLNILDTGGLLLCVAVLTPRPAHHPLQLDVSKYCRVNENGSFDIYHDGRFGGRSKPKELVLESLRESGRGDLLKRDPTAGMDRTGIHLGRLPAPQQVTPRNTREFVANLLYYGMIRHTIRRALPYSFAD